MRRARVIDPSTLSSKTLLAADYIRDNAKRAWQMKTNKILAGVFQTLGIRHRSRAKSCFVKVSDQIESYPTPVTERNIRLDFSVDGKHGWVTVNHSELIAALLAAWPVGYLDELPCINTDDFRALLDLAENQEE